MNRFVLAFLLATGVATLVGGRVLAQDLSPEETKARIERLEKQNQELLQYLQRTHAPAGGAMLTAPQVTPTGPGGGQPPAASQDDVKKIVGDYIEDQEAKKKAAEDAAKAKAEDEGYKVGTDLNFKATWKDGLYFTTPNNDFTMHIGGWIQYDNVFYNQSHSLLTPQDGFSNPNNTKGAVVSGANRAVWATLRPVSAACKMGPTSAASAS